MAQKTRGLYRRSLPSGSWVWVAEWYDPDGQRQRRSTQTQDRLEAQSKRDDWARRDADPAYAAAHETTVGDAATTLMQSLERAVRHGQRQAASLPADRSRLGHFVRLCGDLTLLEVTSAALDHYVQQREDEGASRESVRKEAQLWRQLLRQCVRSGCWTGIPEQVVPQVRSDYTPRDRVLSEDELRRLLATLTHDRAAWVAYSLAVGAERSACLAATREHQVVEGVEMVRVWGTKTDTRDRWVPLVLPWQRQLWAYAVVHGQGPQPRLLRGWTEGSSSRDLRAACARAGIDPVRLHDLRHTTAEWLLRDGVSLDLARRILGHTDDAMLRRVYARQVGLTTLAALARMVPGSLRPSAGALQKAKLVVSIPCDAGVPNTDENRGLVGLVGQNEVSGTAGNLQVSGRAMGDSNARPLAPEANALNRNGVEILTLPQPRQDGRAGRVTPVRQAFCGARSRHGRR